MQIHLLNMLATWRLTTMLIEERAPYAVLDRVREYIEKKKYSSIREDKSDTGGIIYMATKETNFWYEISEALQCQFCLSVWVGISVAIVTRQNPLYGLAYSAGALLFGRLFERLDNG